MEQNDQPAFALHVDAVNGAYLSESAKWAKFLAILGFIMCGFIVILAFFIGTIMNMMTSAAELQDLEGAPMPMTGMFGSGFLTILYLVIAIVYFIPCLFLYRFADKTQQALLANDQAIFTSGLQNLKSLFRFMGILTIIVLCLYVLGIIAAVFFAASFSSM